MRKTSAEVSPVNIDISKLGEVNLFASWTEDLEPRSFQSITKTNRKDLLLVAQSSWAIAVYTTEVFLVNFGHSSWSVNVSIMNKSIQVACLLVKLQEMFIREVLFIRSEGRKDHFHTGFELILWEVSLETV
jgi:hypothetical protein